MAPTNPIPTPIAAPRAAPAARSRGGAVGGQHAEPAGARAAAERCDNRSPVAAAARPRAAPSQGGPVIQPAPPLAAPAARHVVLVQANMQFATAKVGGQGLHRLQIAGAVGQSACAWVILASGRAQHCSVSFKAG